MSVQNVLNKLTKWRGVFAGWQLGTRLDTDPECQAARPWFQYFWIWGSYQAARGNRDSEGLEAINVIDIAIR